MGSSNGRNLALIVPSGVTLLGILALLTVARFWDFVPIKPPACGFRQFTGFPCIGCGGTRCMIALSQGRILQSFLFNPAIFTGVVVIVVWFIRSLIRYLKSDGAPIWPAEQTRAKRLLKRWFLTVGLPLLVLLNWIYLAIYLPK